MYMYVKFQAKTPSSFGWVGGQIDRQTEGQMRYAINNILDGLSP